jgi:nucleoside-diphosphate-sugar epimerase
MRVFVAGAAGAIGQQLLPQLVAQGHQVTASTRSPAKAARLRELGAEPVVLDGLDAMAVGEAVARAEPEAVVHQMTSLAAGFDLRHFDRMFAVTNRLRTQGTDHLLAAAAAAGARRFIAQSYTGWPNIREGGPVKTEDDPLDPDPPAAQRESLAAIRYLDRVVPAAAPMQGIVLRYGSFYGPGASEALSASSGSGGCRSSATAPGSGRSCTSATRPRRRPRRWNKAGRASTTSWTTSRPGSRNGCRSWRGRSARSRPAGYRYGSGGSPPGRPRLPR